MMEVLSYTIILFGMKLCNNTVDMIGMKEISKGNCVAVPSQKYNKNFVKSLSGKVIEIKEPKYCTIKVQCQTSRELKPVF